AKAELHVEPAVLPLHDVQVHDVRTELLVKTADSVVVYALQTELAKLDAAQSPLNSDWSGLDSGRHCSPGLKSSARLRDLQPGNSSSLMNRNQLKQPDSELANYESPGYRDRRLGNAPSRRRSDRVLPDGGTHHATRTLYQSGWKGAKS